VSYILELRPEVKDDFKKLDKAVASRILKKLQWLSEQGEEISHQSLSANLAGFYKLRVGDYRVIYKLETETKDDLKDEGSVKNQELSEDKAGSPETKTEPKAKVPLDPKIVVYFVGHRRDVYKKLE
jgi:mRNA interferase RelE/StbE